MRKDGKHGAKGGRGKQGRAGSGASGGVNGAGSPGSPGSRGSRGENARGSGRSSGNGTGNGEQGQGRENYVLFEDYRARREPCGKQKKAEPLFKPSSQMGVTIRMADYRLLKLARAQRRPHRSGKLPYSVQKMRKSHELGSPFGAAIPTGKMRGEAGEQHAGKKGTTALPAASRTGLGMDSGEWNNDQSWVDDGERNSDQSWEDRGERNNDHSWEDRGERNNDQSWVDGGERQLDHLGKEAQESERARLDEVLKGLEGLDGPDEQTDGVDWEITARYDVPWSPTPTSTPRLGWLRDFFSGSGPFHGSDLHRYGRASMGALTWLDMAETKLDARNVLTVGGDRFHFTRDTEEADEYDVVVDHSALAFGGGKRRWWMQAVRRALLSAAVVTLVLGLSGVAMLKVLKEQPLPVATVSQTSEILDRDGEVLATFHVGENRRSVALDEVSPYLIEATLAIEDHRFYEHYGFDPHAMARAVWVNVKEMRTKQGASTITQQLARNLYLTQERTWKRKIKEAMYTLQLEMNYGKDEILEMYLNQIYYGHGAYGVEAASRLYYGKHAAELTLAEAALLAGIPKGPTYYSPFNDPERARARQQTVLAAMAERGILTEQQAAVAGCEALQLMSLRGDDAAVATVGGAGAGGASSTGAGVSADGAGAGSAEAGVSADGAGAGGAGVGGADGAEASVSAGGAEAGAPYFRDYVQSVATAELGIDEHLLLEGGVRIYTTLDAKTQAAAEAAVRAAVSGTSEQQAALVAIEPATGYIRAMVGGLDYAEHQYNRAVNALRQPGSAFKPVLYAAALQDRMATPVTRIMSEPTVFTYDEGRQTYTPHNYNYNYAEKEIDMREAIASSDNIYAVSTLMNVGAERVIAYAGEMGIAPERLAAVPSLALGSSPVSPLEMASAFSTFAAGGVRTAPTAVVRIEDRSGRVLYEAEPTRTRVVGAAEAYVMTSMLEGVFGDSGTARRVAATIKRPVAGKTGTTATDAWLVGYTPQLATAVWVGYDKDRKLSKAESHMAAPIFAQFTEQALSDVPPADFPMPLGVARVFIDPLSGKLAGPDCTEQRAEYFVRGTEPREFCDAHYGSLQERLHAEEATLSDDATRDKKRSFWQGFRRLWGG